METEALKKVELSNDFIFTFLKFCLNFLFFILSRVSRQKHICFDVNLAVQFYINCDHV